MGIISLAYKPMYSVTLNGEFIGYTTNKSNLQNRINEYIENGDGTNVAFIDIQNLPEYSLCLLKKDNQTNDDEIFEKVKNSGSVYYEYYAIVEKSQEKYYVSTYEEADAIVNDLKNRNSQNKDTVTYTLKYETELKEFTNKDTAVAALYKEMPVKKKTPVVTSKNLDYSKTPLEIGLIEPVRGTITSRFGRRSGGQHTGLDIANSTGTPIKAAAAGTVVYAAYRGSYGRLVIIQHTNSTQTYYAHCSKLYVSVGQTVSQGETIAAVGSTGNSTGPHLHLEVRVNGVAKNPQNYVY